jgi:hypothetical protein
MESFSFIEPSGDFLNAPTAEKITALMRQGDEEYWGPYSPVGRLDYGNPPASRLFLLRHPRRGWYVQYDTFDAPARCLVAIDPEGDRGAWVEHWAEGDISYFLAACFVPLVVAERVVEDFMASRQPSPSAVWEPFDGRLHWREEPPDDESAVVEAADPEG